MRRIRKSSDRVASKGYPNPIDVHVGNRIRLRRTLLGISQVALAELRPCSAALTDSGSIHPEQKRMADQLIGPMGMM